MGAVAGIVVGVLAFVALAVIGVVSANLLTCYFKCRHTSRYFRKVESEGLENPNYGDVDRGPAIISQNQTTAQKPSDYEVPVPSISNSKQHAQEQRQQHNSFVQQQPGKQTQKYVNIPNQNLTSSHAGSGEYSYVFVGHPQHQPVCPRMSYDSYYLLSSEESLDLPTFVAVESGEPTSNYTLMGADSKSNY